MLSRIAIPAGCALLVTCAIAQQSDRLDQTSTRRLWEANFLSRRPPGPSSRPIPVTSADDAYVGVTLWRLRPGKAAERVSSRTPLMRGATVRISIESARAGYLYVIERREDAEGVRSSPDMIFPAQGARGGDNRVMAGTVVDFPVPTLRRPNQAYEVFTIYISPQPIPGVTDRIPLTEEQVTELERRWRIRVGLLEEPAMTRNGGSSQLTQDDPLPQDIYHSDAQVGDPMLVDVPIDVHLLSAKSAFGNFSGGGLAGIAVPSMAAPLPSSSGRVTAGAFLTPQQDEVAGYGLYSYILFGSRPESIGSERWRRYYETILSYLTIPTADELSRYVPRIRLNTTYLLITVGQRELPTGSLQPIVFNFDKERVAAHAMEHQATGKPFAGHIPSNSSTACTLVSNYDYPRAQKLLMTLPEAHLEGPYIISTTQPLSKTLTLPAEYLYQDLSSVPPELIDLWIREFMAQAQEKEFWRTRTKEQFVLRIRTAIGIMSQQVPDFGNTITWAFVRVPQPR